MLDGMDTVLGRVENIFGIRETLQMRANSFPDAKIFFTEKRNEKKDFFLFLKKRAKFDLSISFHPA